MARKLDWTLISLSVALVFLLGLGVVSLVAFFALNSNSPTDLTWAEPWSAVDGTRVPPDLGFLPLAGDSADSVVRRAIDANELDAGYALAIQSTELTDAQRAGQLLLLGKRYAQTQQLTRASLCFRLAHEIAAISPTMPDIARGETALQAADGWLSSEKPALARASLDMAEALATASPFLLDVQRVDLFNRLAAFYLKLDDRSKSDALRKLATNLPPRTASSSPLSTHVLESWPQLPPVAETVTQTLTARQTEFNHVVNGLLAGRMLTDADVQKLEPLLLAENQARQDAYRQLLDSSDVPLAQKVATQHAWVNWLTLKWRVARLDLQASLVPAWEQERDAIAEELSAEQANLFALSRDLASALNEGANLKQAQFDVLRAELLRGRLGFYPSYPLDELAARLIETQNELGGSALRLVLRQVDQHLMFTLELPVQKTP